MSFAVNKRGDCATLAYAIALFAFALVAPVVLNVNTFGVVRLLWTALEENRVVYLYDACLRLVALNALRAFPIYLGAFTLAGMGPSKPGVRGFLEGLLIPAVIVPIGYLAINWVYGIAYDFRMPAVLSILVVAAVLRMGKTEASEERWKAASVIAILIAALQWLDLAPALTTWGFGHGEVSMDIKAAAEAMGASALLGNFTIVTFALFTCMGLLMSKVMIDYRTHIRLVEDDRRRSVELARMEAEAVQARTRRELDALMHDLRTPLTTVQGLASALAEFPDTDPLDVATYAGRISDAAEKMDTMIREMLNGETMQCVPAVELARRLASHLPEEKTGGAVSFRIGRDLPDVIVNVTRMIRALVNLIDNAVDAGACNVDVSFLNVADSLAIVITDDGMGMNDDEFVHCCEAGFSTKNSTGLGLPFVGSVIREHGGTLRIESCTHEQARRLPGSERGTVCEIILPGAKEAADESA